MHQYRIVEKGVPLEKAKKAIIMLHGRGGTAMDILSLANPLNAKDFYLVAPQASNNTWYPYSFMTDVKANEPWLSSAIDTIKRLIDATATHISLDRIFILGFSQGACLALETASRYADKYGGIIAFTGGLIGKTIDEQKYQGSFEGSEVFIGNSDKDPHVPLLRSQQSAQLMEKLGAKVTLKVYPGMSHTISEDEILWVKTHLLNT